MGCIVIGILVEGLGCGVFQGSRIEEPPLIIILSQRLYVKRWLTQTIDLWTKRDSL